MNLMLAASGLQDADWRKENALAIQKRIRALYQLANQPGPEATNEVLRWLWSRLQSHIKDITQHFERMETSTAAHIAFHRVWEDVRWYRLRSGKPPPASFLRTWSSLLAPFIPHCAEEMWSKVKGKGFVSTAPWPSIDESLMDAKVERLEEMVKSTLEDLRHVVKLVGKKKSAYLYAATQEEAEHLKRCASFFKSQFGFERCEAWIASDPNRHDPMKKASKAKPGKPAIYLE
jgi:leucyl-tRNA synthetase